MLLRSFRRLNGTTANNIITNSQIYRSYVLFAYTTNVTL
jgi:hypothetical protein